MVSPNVDLRAAFEGATIQEEMGDGLYWTVGQYPALMLAPSRLRWLENNRPDLYDRLGCLLTIGGMVGLPAYGRDSVRTVPGGRRRLGKRRNGNP